MRFLSLEVWHWRGLEHEFLDDLAPGLNLVYGPNEAGKSRLFQALRTALWESYKGQASHKKEWQGWASTESPRVAIAFELEGRRYRLEKQFLKGGFARLEGDGVTLKNEDAEERLQQLLGIGASGSRKLPEEERGLWRLLWVEQGTSQRAAHQDLNVEPRARLQNLVAREVGEITAGEQGEHLLERVKQELIRYWTAAKLAPTGEFRQAIQRQEEAEAAVAAAEEKKRKAEGETEALLRCRRRLASLEPRRAEQQNRVKEARQRRVAAEEVERRLEAEEGRLASLEVRVEQARSQLQQRLQGAAALDRLQAEGADLEEQLAKQEQAADSAEQEKRLTAEALSIALQGKEKAQQRAREARAAARREDLARDILELEKTCQESRREAESLAEVENLLATTRGSRKDLDRLEELERRLQGARARLEASGARVSLSALSELEVTTSEGKQPISPGAALEATITDRQFWEIPGLVRFEVAPGGKDLEASRVQVRELEAALTSSLEEFGSKRLEDLRGLVERREQALSERRLHQQLLQRSAPQGVAVLEGRLAGMKKELAALEGARGSEVAASEDGASSKAGSVEEADVALEAAEKRLEGARGLQEQAASRYQEIRLRLATLGAQQQGLAERKLSSSERLAKLPGSEELQEAVAQQEKLQGEVLLRMDTLRRELDSMGGSGARSTVEQAERALERLEQEHSSALEEVRSLEGSLRARGEEGLHEALQEAEQEREAAGSERARVERRAQAVLKLWQVLEEERRLAQERFTEPVRRRIEPYLQALFPGSELSLDDRWQVAGLATGDLQENLSELSFGAQEQIGVLVRLGLAEILASEGRLPLVLDDALVHTDADRRQTMLQILGRASEHLQVIVLTCHESDYDALGPSRSYRLTSHR